MKTQKVFHGVCASMTSFLFTCLLSTPAVGIALLGFAPDAAALTCGAFDGRVCSGTAFQYAGGFSPNAGEYGGFGGAATCTVTRTPVVFVHGNGDNATSFDAPTFQVPGYTKPPSSIYQQLKAAGYKDCELFGVTYLSASQRAAPQTVYETESKYAIVENFIKAVLRYTGQAKVDIVSHSLGVSTAMAALSYYGDWGSVRRFVNIAGGLHGLDSCIWVGYANAYAPTCGSQNIYDGWIFGMYPNAWVPGVNPWTGTSAWNALPNAADSNTSVSFYTIYAGIHDELMCVTTSDYANCGNSPLLKNTYGNVKAQLNIGAGANASQLDWNWADGAPWSVAGGDSNGVGHFHTRSNSGKIIANMLTTTCTGTGCASGYTYGPVQ
jgi:pimeloyl-ACP methyl ester carboxylesterase